MIAFKLLLIVLGSKQLASLDDFFKERAQSGLDDNSNGMNGLHGNR